MPLEFAVGDLVYHCGKKREASLRPARKAYLTPRYIGPFPILARVGRVAYRIQLSEKLQGRHNVFHLSMFMIPHMC